MLSQLLVLLILAVPPSEDYFGEITVASEGRITHFERMPITVYVEPCPPAFLEYAGTAGHALECWQEASEGVVNFQRVDDPTNADVRLSWSQRPLRYQREARVAEASLVREDSERFHVEIQVNLRQWPSLAPWGIENVYLALLHEIGHAIGLWGHSEDPGDVLYHANSREQISTRDKRTLLRLYETPVGTAHHAQALASLRRQIEQDPRNARLYYFRGTVQMSRGDYAGAVQSLQRALELDPEVAAYATRLGMLLEAQGKTAAAIRHYEQAVKLQPNGAGHAILGTLYLMQEDFPQAVAAFEKALLSDRQNSVLQKNRLAVYHLWGLHLLRAEQYDEAAQVIDEAMQWYEFSPILSYDRAVAYEGQGEYAQAIAQYEHTLVLDENLAAARIGLASAWNNLGTQYTNKRQWEGAIACYQKALEWDANCREAARNLEVGYLQQAWEEHARGNTSGAIRRYQDILSRQPQSVEAYHNLGLIYLSQEQYAEAAACLEQALALTPDSTEVRSDLRYVRRQQWVTHLRGVMLPVFGILFLAYAVVKWTYRRVEKLER